MKTYREFYITGSDLGLKKFINDMPSFIKKPWIFEKNTIGGEPYLVFTYDGQKLPKSDVFLHFSNETQKYTLANIVPIEVSELNTSEYNSLAQLFYDYLQAYKNPDICISKLSKDIVEQSDVMSKETMNTLKTFSDIANKSTGSSHPLDRERWYSFILTAYRTGDFHNLDADMLQTFLIEDYGWNKEKAFNLAFEYDFGIGLLNKAE